MVQKPITNFFICKKPITPNVDLLNNKNREDEQEKRKFVNDAVKEKDDELLKSFDLNWIFGPCCGISRLERWERAAKHSLNPPQEVKELILKHNNNVNYIRCIWDQNALLRPMGFDSCTFMK